MNLLLTGARGIGKTSVCQGLVRIARARGRHARGVLTPPLYDADGAKVGFEALDVSSDQRWLLAHTGMALDGPRIGAYIFDQRGLRRAVDVVRGAISVGADLLIVDEIGPLELIEGGGFAPLLTELPLDGPGHLLLVVRPALVGELCSQLGEPRMTLYTVTRDNRERLPCDIVQALWPGAAC